jgi:hypothetical protein
MPSNQKTAWLKAEEEVANAKKAGVTGQTLSQLQANAAAKRAALESATGRPAESSS